MVAKLPEIAWTRRRFVRWLRHFIRIAQSMFDPRIKQFGQLFLVKSRVVEAWPSLPDVAKAGVLPR